MREEVASLKKQLAERKKREELRYEIESIILLTYKGEALDDIQYYKNAIIDNCYIEIISSDEKLKRYITLYYDYFKGVKLSLEEYLFLYNYQVKPEREIEDIITTIYDESKRNFRNTLKKKYPERVKDYNDEELKYMTNGYALNNLEKLEKINTFYNSVKKSSPKAQKDICDNLCIKSIDVLDKSDDIELTIEARNIKTIESFPGIFARKEKNISLK